MLRAYELRIERGLYRSVVADLSRPHPHAEERVGFLFGKLVAGEHSLILLNRYVPIPDERYLESTEFGAVIDSAAITETMQALRDKRGSAECAFHVHMHLHKGCPNLSRPDLSSLPKLLPGFHRMCPDGAHGLLVFSIDSGRAWVWDPVCSELVIGDAVVVVGAPLSVFSQARGKQS